MPYIGTSPSNGVRRVHTYTATASQTTFTGASSEGVTLSYVDTNYIDVFQNGVLLGSADYTSTSGTSVILAQGASADDLIVIVVYDVFSVADTVSKTNGGSFDSAVTMSNNLTVSGAFTSQGIDDNADATAITIDSSEQVGIGTTTPVSGTKLTINDSAFGGLQFQSGGSDCGYIGVNTNTLFVGGGSAVAFHTGNAQATDGTERMRIDSSGNLLVNTTSSTGFKMDLNANGGAGLFTQNIGSGTIGVLTRPSANHNYNAMRFDNSSASIVGTISVGTGSTSFNTTSDYRLKENVTYDFDATTRLKQLKPCRFNFKIDTDNTVDGFLAHEVSSVVPEAITGEKDAVDADGNIDPQGIDQSKLVPLLVKTIQELEARITALENAE